MQKGYVLYCSECGESELEISYADGADFPGEALTLSTHCPQCGATGLIRGLSVASMKIRAEKNTDMMAAAMALKHLAAGKPEFQSGDPSDEDVERWAKTVADEQYREMTAEDRRKAREFLEWMPEALVAEAGDERSESSEKRAKTRKK